GLNIHHNEKRFVGFSRGTKSIDADVHCKYIYEGHVASYMKAKSQDNPFSLRVTSSSFLIERRDYGVADDDYEVPPVFDDDQYEKEIVKEESMPIYDTDIEDVIKEEEGFCGKEGFGGEEDNIEYVVVVANDLSSSRIQTT
ncbi:cyclic nucleotide-binding domain-containing protein, partial [Tanacetum coccineum]